MTLRPLRAALAVALAAGSLAIAAGCDRVDSPDKAASPQPDVAAATKVTEGTFAAAAPAAATAAAPAAAPADGDKMACGNAEMADGTCAGEGGEAGGCSQWDKAAADVGKRATPADAVWATIPVTGMTCGGCERRIIANLGEVDGVLGVEADAELGQVRVAHARGKGDITGTARAKIAALGYKPN